jgi:Zn-finger nucleic acid-binding protein
MACSRECGLTVLAFSITFCKLLLRYCLSMLFDDPRTMNGWGKAALLPCFRVCKQASRLLETVVWTAVSLFATINESVVVTKYLAKKTKTAIYILRLLDEFDIIKADFGSVFVRLMVMTFDFSCPECGLTIQVDNSAAGEMGACPKCQAEVLIQRGSVITQSEESQKEQLSQRSPTAMPNRDVELGIGTTIVTRIIVILVFLCIISGGGYGIYNGFEMFGYSYDGVVGLLEDKVDNGLSDYQKQLIKQTNENKGPPDYSHLAVDLPDRAEEDMSIDEFVGASGGNGGDFGGGPTGGDGGEDGGRQGSGERRFDPEAMFTARDKDENGFLSADEISERMQSRVEAMDEDKDGAISKEEFLKSMQRFRSSRQGGGGSAPQGDEN